MERDFPPHHRQHFGRQFEPPFHQNNRLNEDFWEDKCFPEMPPPGWNEPYPNQHWERPPWEFNNFGKGNFPDRGRGWNYPRGNYHNNRPYRGRYRGFKSNFSKGRGRYQKSPRPSCLVNMMPTKKENNSTMVEAQSVPTKITEGQKDSTGEKEADSSKQVKMKDKVSEDPPSLTSRELSTEECTDSTETCPTIQKQEASVEILQVPEIKQDASLSDLTGPSAAVEPHVPLDTKEATTFLDSMETEQKSLQSELKDSPDAENSPSGAVLIPSIEAPKEEQVSLETIEDLHTTGDKEPMLVKDSQAQDQSCHFNSSLTVDIPFLSEIAGEHQHKGKQNTVQIQTADTDKVVDQHQACIAVVIHPANLSDVSVVPMLVREEKSGMQSSLQVYPRDATFFHTGNLCSWAPEGCQEPVQSVSHPGECDKDLEQGTGLSPAPISCNWKCDARKLLEGCTCSPRSQYSSDSRHSNTNQAPRGMHVQCSRSQQQELSLQQREQHSGSLLRKKEDSFWRNCNQSCHNKCYCSVSQENFQEKDSCSRCLLRKINHHHSRKERHKPYRMPQLLSSKNALMKMRKRKLTYREKTKKTMPTSDKGTQSAKLTKKSRKEQADRASVPSGAAEKIQLVKTEEPELVQMTKSSENEPSAGIATDLGFEQKKLRERSAVILATKEKIERTYQQVLLNFAAVTTMLLETDPSMEASIESALRANLRKIGNYYECMLKNFIDSYDLANAS